MLIKNGFLFLAFLSIFIFSSVGFTQPGELSLEDQAMNDQIAQRIYSGHPVNNLAELEAAELYLWNRHPGLPWSDHECQEMAAFNNWADDDPGPAAFMGAQQQCENDKYFTTAEGVFHRHRHWVCETEVCRVQGTNHPWGEHHAPSSHRATRVSTPGRMTKPRPVHGLSGRPLPYGGRPSPYGSSGRGGGRSPYY